MHFRALSLVGFFFILKHFDMRAGMDYYPTMLIHWLPSAFMYFFGKCGKTVKRSTQSNDAKTRTRTSPKDWEMDN